MDAKKKDAKSNAKGFRVSSLANGQPLPLEARTLNTKRPAADLPTPPRTRARGGVGAIAPRATRISRGRCPQGTGGKEAPSSREPQIETKPGAIFSSQVKKKRLPPHLDKNGKNGQCRLIRGDKVRRYSNKIYKLRRKRVTENSFPLFSDFDKTKR